MTLEEALEKYEPVIGLEIHAQLTTLSKAFCSDPNEYGATPNTNISPISLGHPGTLPKLNKEVVSYAVRLGLALNANITKTMHFDRKNYFYADLPKGYQITQDKTPICRGGYVLIKDDEGNEKHIELTRVHMEEDSGKSIHDQDPFHTLIDLNRAGVPLLEIVTEPVIKSGKEAYNYLTEMRKLLRYLEVCDGNMEEGSMRCDVNISIMPKGTSEFGNRCEVKNLNSIRNVQRAIEHEIVRHAEILDNGEEVDVQTRNFDATTGTTSGLRSKEAAHDYRYFPEPDLTRLTVTDDYIEAVRKNLPPLPNDLLNKYITKLNLSEYDALNLTDSKGIALYFEELILTTKNYKAAANWVMGNVKSYLNQQAIEISEFHVTPSKISELIALIDDGKVNNSVASQKIFPELINQPDLNIEEFAIANGFIKNDDAGELESVILKIFTDNPNETERFKNGEKKLTGFFMGLVMRETKGSADPKTTSKLLNELINK